MELKDKLIEFLRSYYYNELQEASKERTGRLIVEFEDLDKFDPQVSDKLLEDPDSVLPVFDEAVEDIDLPNDEKINVRIIELPKRQEIRARQLRAKHIGKFITLDLTVKSASEVKPKIYEAVFKCPDCDNLITIPQKGKTLKSPSSCDCGRRGRFELKEKKMMDIRWVSCNEPFEITEGEQPGQINVFLKEDLTTPKMQRKTDPGNRLKVTGVLREVQKKKQGKLKTRMDMHLEANSVTSAEMEFDEIDITPEDEKKIKEIAASDDLFRKLKDSIAPGIYGYDEIKEAIALQLFGGVTKRMPDGTKTRGNIHILMTGDPGIGKSVSGSSMILHNSKDKPEFSSIGQFVDKQIESGKKINQGDTEISFNENKDIKVASLDPNTYSLEWKPVSAFLRHETPKKLLKITTHSGRTITATKDHSFITMDTDGKIKPLQGKCLDKKTFLPVPLNTHKKMIDKVNIKQKIRTNALQLPEQIDLDWDFGFFLGLFIAEGSISKGTIYLSSHEEKNKQLISDFLNKIGLNPTIDDRRLFVSSKNFSKFLKEQCYDGKKKGRGKGSGASRKSIPNFAFFAPKKFLKGLLSGLFSGDGYYVNSRPRGKNRTKGNLKLGITTVSKTLSSGLMELLASLGIFNTIRRKKYNYKNQEKTSYEITVKGKHAKNLMKEIKLIGKEPKIQRVSSKDFHDVLPCVDLLYDIVRDLGYSERLREDSEKRRAFSAMMRTVRSRKKLGRRRLQRIYEKLKKECIKQKKKKTMKKLNKLKKILDSNIVWDQVKTIEEISSNEDYVYDLSIDGNENFSVNNTLVHNSQLLKLASKAIPRGKYVSGKGVSGAGLCTTYDSLINIDGKLTKIGDLVEEKLKSGSKEIKPGVFVSKNPDKENIASLDKKSKKIENKKTTQYYKIKAPSELVEIETRTGRKVTVTLDNPILTIKNGKLEWKKAKNLKKSDYIASARKLPSPRNDEIFSLNSIDPSAKVLNAVGLVNQMTDKIKSETTIRDFAEKNSLNENALYHNWRKNSARGQPKLKNLLNICNELDMNPTSVFPDKLSLSQYNGHKITIPKIIDNEFMYLAGIMAGDGSISRTSYGGADIKFTCGDDYLMDKFKNICNQELNIEPSYKKVKNRIPYLRFRSKILSKIMGRFGIPVGKKSEKLKITNYLSSLPNELIGQYLKGMFDTDGCIYHKNSKVVVSMTSVREDFIRRIQLLLLRFGIISRIRKRKPTKTKINERDVKSKEKWMLEITGLENVKLFRKYIGFEIPRKQKALEKALKGFSIGNTNVDIIPNTGKFVRKIRNKIGMTAKELYGYKNYSYEQGRQRFSRNKLKEISSKLKEESDIKEVEHLENLANSDILWEPIKKVRIFENKDHDFVYDVTVDNEHSFVCNGMVIHNTATVVKDEEMGGWVLEAGAIVLANKGIISIDEFDKMHEDDQIAMHEAMSIGTISIAKANIVATLPGETSVLAGANPKFGRFDPYKSIIEQIDIPETLLSRFDLKFALRDKPEEENDRRIAQHIINNMSEPESAEPEIDRLMLRKYISYARQIEEMDITQEASKTLMDFYVDMRSRGSDSETPVVAITFRQYEAMIRIAEASARAQLKKKVEVEDAERAIDLMKFSLKQLSTDPETGEFDIDVMESGTSSKQRSRINEIMDMIKELQEDTGGEVYMEDLQAEAENRGIEKEKVDEVVEKLKQDGRVFSPKHGTIRIV